MIELKPCPLCGGIAMLQKRKRFKKFPFRIRCSNIPCGCRTANWNQVDGAVKSWNRRVTEQSAQKTGEWIRNDNGTYSCSVCHSWIPNEQHYYAQYCLCCGARMELEQDG